MYALVPVALRIYILIIKYYFSRISVLESRKIKKKSSKKSFKDRRILASHVLIIKKINLDVNKFILNKKIQLKLIEL